MKEVQRATSRIIKFGVIKKIIRGMEKSDWQACFTANSGIYPRNLKRHQMSSFFHAHLRARTLKNPFRFESDSSFLRSVLSRAFLIRICLAMIQQLSGVQIEAFCIHGKTFVLSACLLVLDFVCRRWIKVF